MPEDQINDTVEPDTAATPSEINADATETAPANDVHPDDAKWRQRFRETEAQLTVEQARVSELNRNEIQRLAAVGLQDPKDLFLDGTSPSELCGEDGLVDPDLVAEKVAEVIAAHPHWKRAKPVVGAPSEKVNSDGRIPSGATEPTWGDFLRGNKSG